MTSLSFLSGDLVRHLADNYFPLIHRVVLREVSLRWSQYLPLQKKDKKLPTLYITWGSVPLLEWCKKRKYPIPTDICRLAAQGGHLEVLKWARWNGCEWEWSTCAYAAEGGHIEVLKWARENGCPEA